MRAHGLLLVALAACSAPPEPCDLVLLGGRVYTADDSSPWAEALAVRGGRIAAVGTRSEIERLVGATTRVVDLDGRLALPAFIDGYVHLLRGARFVEGPPLGEAESREELLALVRAHAAKRPPNAWIAGVGWRYHVLGRPPSRDELDAAVSGRPALLLSQDGRAAWASSRALEIAAVSSGDALLVESTDIAEVESAIPVAIGPLTEKVVRSAHRNGITAVHVAPGEDVEAPFDLAIHVISSTSERPRVDGWERPAGGELEPLRGAVVGVHPKKISPDWVPLERRSDDAFPLKSLYRTGALVVFGSDWPFAPFDPLAGIAAAVTRANLEGRPEGGYSPGERLSVEEAVLAYTRNGARAMSAGDERGSLGPGKRADVAVLSEDIFSIAPERIAEVQVVMTLRNGRIVHAAPSLGTDTDPP
jgi:predicted amidohydrolase YtcJ